MKLAVGAAAANKAFNETGAFEYPGGFVPIALINLFFCALVPYLLKDSESGFKSGAIILTSIIPAFVTGFVWYRLLELTGNL